MTRLKSKGNRTRPFLLLAFMALVAAGLFGISQYSSSARAQTVVPLHSSHVGSVHPGTSATGTCPTPPAGMKGWYGWHFVLPSNEDFTSLSVTFQTAGTISADPFPGTFISHPDASHAYVWTATADTLLSGTSTTNATESPAFFNLSSTCAPVGETLPTASVTIVKQGLMNADSATFSQNFDATGNFSLGGTNGTSVMFDSLEAGSYAVTEQDLAGYVLTGAACLTDSPEAQVANTFAGSTLTVTLVDGQHLTCTFVNAAAQVMQYDVTLTKFVDGALATAGSFAFTSTWQADNLNGGLQASGNFSLDSGNGFMAVTSPMDAGASYNVLENGIDATCDVGDTYRLAAYSVGATAALAALAARTATLSLDNLEADAYVIVWNDACDNLGSIRIVKDFAPDAAVDANFTVEGSGLAAFSIMEGDANSQTFENLSAAGAYTFTETDLAGWTVSNIVCTGHTNTLWDTDFPTGVLVVNLVDGEDLVCTFTNTADISIAEGSLTVIKNWVGGTAAAASFSASANLGDADNAFILNGTTTQVVFNNLADANYVIDEATLAGWTVTSIVCTGQTNSVSTPTLATGVLNVNLMDGEDVVCTFTNTANTSVAEGSLTIIKNWVGGIAAAASFSASANLGDADNAFILNGTMTQVVFNNLDDANYGIDEATLAGWTVTSIVCTGQTNSVSTPTLATGVLNVNLAAGEAIVCTFTNTAIIESPVVNDTEIPGVVSPSVPVQPGQPTMTAPNQPVVNTPNQPIVNTPNQPSIIGGSPVPAVQPGNEAPQSNVAGERQPGPLAPQTGNGLESSSTTNQNLGLSLALAAMAGSAAVIALKSRTR